MCLHGGGPVQTNWAAWLFAFKDKSNQVPALANKKWTKVINSLWFKAVKTESLLSANSRNCRAHDPFPYWFGHVQVVSSSNSHYEFLSPAILPCPKPLLGCWPLWPPAPVIFLLPFLQRSLSLAERMWYRRTLCGWVLHGHLFSALWSAVHLYSNYHPLHAK